MANYGRPEIFNTDPSAACWPRLFQRSDDWPPGQSWKPVHQPPLYGAVDRRRGEGIHGRPRSLARPILERAIWVFIERLWRSLKYECVYLSAFETGSEARAGIGKWLTYYNAERPHSALGGKTPEEAHTGNDGIRLAA